MKSFYLEKMREFEKCIDLAKIVTKRSKLLKNVVLTVRSLFAQAGGYYYLGRINDSLKVFKQAQEIIENQEREKNTVENEALLLLYKGRVYAWMGYIASQTGQWNQSLNLYERSLKFFQELGNKLEFDYKEIRNELDIDYQEIGNKLDIGNVLQNLAYNYLTLGKVNKALEYGQQGLQTLKEIENKQHYGRYKGIAYCHITIISIYLAKNNLDQAQEQFTQFEGIYEKEDRIEISQLYRYTKAMILMTGTRITEKAKSQEILQQLITEDLILPNSTIFYILLNFCRLLISELKSYGEEVVLQHIKSILVQMEMIAKKLQSSDFLVKTLIFQARLSLVDGDFQGAEALLEQANDSITEIDSESLKKWISDEIRELYTDMGNGLILFRKIYL